MNYKKSNSVFNLLLSNLLMLAIALITFYALSLLSFYLLLEFDFLKIFGPPTVQEKIIAGLFLFCSAILSSTFSNWVTLKTVKFRNLPTIKLFIFLQFITAFSFLIVFDFDTVLQSSTAELLSYIMGSVISILISFFFSKSFLTKNKVFSLINFH